MLRESKKYGKVVDSLWNMAWSLGFSGQGLMREVEEVVNEYRKQLPEETKQIKQTQE